MQTLFGLATLAVAPFWLLMLLLPGWSVTRRLIAWPIAELLLGVVYVVLAATVLPSFVTTFSRPTITSVAAFLSTPVGVTIGWVHFLAFDLFVGRWIYRDSRTRGISAWLAAPALVLTLFAGPAGPVLYMTLRAALGAARPGKAAVLREGGTL